ncbi:MAG: hypothetical protein KGS72_13730 [Cyanobacteria bacterium REEB67]|nr:hypothetical protein [Cyanobacteria bacterium REEB67]
MQRTRIWRAAEVSDAGRPAIGAFGLACTVALADPLLAGQALANGAGAPMASPGNWQSHAAALPASMGSASTTAGPAFSANHAGSSTFASFSTYAQSAAIQGANSTHLHTFSQVPIAHQSLRTALFGHGLVGSKTAASVATGRPGPHDLDLTSNQASFAASNLAGFRDLTIVVGGVKQVVSLDSKLTSAEVVAAEQILNGGTQTIRLTADGRAIGGLVTLNNNLISAISATMGGGINTLTIARGVKVIDSLSSLTLTGNLDNYGSLLTASATQSGARAGDTISADNIFNASDAFIQNYNGSGLLNGLYGADPILNGQTSISNYGTISSHGNLNVTTASLINQGLLTSANGSVNINININAPAITGGATATASAGGSLQNLTIDNGGTISAARGNINVTTADVALNSNIAASGGNWQSRQVNLMAGSGNIDFSADSVSGTINGAGNCVHILTTGTQKLGDITASGDPQYVSLAGNVVIDGTVAATNGADLAIIAGGNVVSGAKGALNTSKSAGGDGGNLTIIAGANVAPGGTNSLATVLDSATVGKGSTTGGIIDLTGKNGGSAAVSQITTAGVGSAGNAGYIEMVAYSGTATGSGSIILPGKVTVNAAGSGTGSNGNVIMIAGATSGTAITSGPIVGKQVTLLTETPTANAGKPAGVVFTDGTSNLGSGGFTGSAVTAGSITSAAITSSAGVNLVSGANITVTTVTANGASSPSSGGQGGAGGTIAINAAGNISATELDAFGAGGTGGGSGAVNGGAGGNGGTVSLVSTAGTVNVKSNIDVSGGGGGGGAGSSDTQAIGKGGAGGTAGAVTLSAAGAPLASTIVVGGEIFAYNGGAGGGGGNGAVTGGGGGGGGGGGSYGGAGGGGAGGVFSKNGENASGGGGGGSKYAPGGGGAGAVGGGLQGAMSAGGVGGGYIALGAGGLFTVFGTNGAKASGTTGGSGGKAAILAGGVGGKYPEGGAGGASTVPRGSGAAGTQAFVAAGSGTITIVSGGGVGTSKAALKFEAGEVAVTAPASNAGVYLSDLSGAALSVGAISTGADSTVSLTTSNNTLTRANGGAVTLLQPVNAGTFTANLSGSLFTSGAGSITAGNLNMTSAGTVSVATNIANLTVIDKVGAVTINQGSNPLNIVGSSTIATGANGLTVTSGGAITVSGTVSGGATSFVDLTETGAAGGITIGGAITTGFINLNSAGTGGITGTNTGKLTAGFIQLISANDIGSGRSPLTVNNNLALLAGNELDLTTGSSGSAFIKELGTTDLLLVPTNASSGALNLTTASSALAVTNAAFSNVSIIDTNAVGKITINSTANNGAIFGDGSGVVYISAGGQISMKASTDGIQGTSVTLISTASDVGSASFPIAATTNALTVSASKGSLYATDSASGSVDFSGNAASTFNLIETGANSVLSINNAVTAKNITIWSTGASADIVTNGALGGSSAAGTVIDLVPTGNLTVLGASTAATINFGGTNINGEPFTYGNILINGPATGASGVLILAGFASSITVNAPLQGGQIRIVDSRLSNQPVALNATIGASSTSYISIVSSGDISTTGGVVLTAANIGLNGNNIGTAATPIVTATNTLSIRMVQDAYVNNTSTDILAVSIDSNANSGAIVFNNSGFGANVTGNVIHDNVSISAAGALTIGADLNSNIAVNNTLSLSSTTGITNYEQLTSASAVITTPLFVNLNTSDGTTTTTATLSATSSVSFASPLSNLNIIGPDGSVSLPVGGALSLSAKGAISSGNNQGNPLIGVNNGTLNSLTINTTAPFISNFSHFAVEPDARGNGGTISITAALIINSGKSAPVFALNAPGTTGNGGSVTLDLVGGAAITIGTAKGNYSINAGGANGGTVEVDTPGNITANMTSLIYKGTGNGNGGNITLNAGGKLLINGDLDTHVGTGSYGTVVLKSGNSAPFLIGGPTGTTTAGIINDSSNKGIRGSDVTITANGGINVANGETILASTGNITLNTTQLTNNGLVSTNGTLTLNNAATITYPTGTGNLNANMSGLDIISSGGGIVLSGALPLVHELTLSAAKGTITVPDTITGFAVTDAGGTAGSITFQAMAVKATLPLSFDAHASLSADAGGSVNFALTGTTAVNIASSTYTFNVAKGSASSVGGALSIANNGNLTVDASAAVLGVGTGKGSAGANLSLTAGSISKGILLISNAASFGDQTIDNLSLQSNSTTPFSLGGATTKTNGITDSGLTISAQTVAIANIGGAIIQGTGGAITANASVTDAVSLVAGKGGIGLSHAVPLDVQASNLAITSADNAYIVDNAPSISLDGVSAGKVLDLSSTGTLAQAVRMTTPTLILAVNSITPGLSTNSTIVAVTVNNGAINIGDNAASVQINTLASPNGAVSLSANGSIKTLATSTISGTSIDLLAGGTAGSVVLNNNLSASAEITLTASGKGTISAAKGVTLTTGNLTLNSGGGNIGGSHTAPLFVDAAVLSIDTGRGPTASAFINDKASSVTLAASNIGNIFDYTGAITAASGAVAAKSLILAVSSFNAASLATTATSITATANAGDINISDSQRGLLTLGVITNKAAAGQVNIDSAGAVTIGGAITAAGGVSVTANGGNLTLAKAITAGNGAVSLTALGGGAIISGGGSISANSTTLTTDGGNIGATTKAVATSANSVDISTASNGDAYVTDTDKLMSGGVTLTAASVGSLKFTETNTKAANTGSLTVGLIGASTGAITIASNEQSLHLNGDLTTANGNVTVQNTFAASKTSLPLLDVAAGTTIHASAADPANNAAGNVYIVLGAVPAASALKPGVVPTTNPPTIITTLTGKVTFGTTTTPTGSITTGSGDKFSGLDRILAFSTGKNAATQIVVGANVIITADPPVSNANQIPAQAPAQGAAAPQAVLLSAQPSNQPVTGATTVSLNRPTIPPSPTSPTVSAVSLPGGGNAEEAATVLNANLLNTELGTINSAGPANSLEQSQTALGIWASGHKQSGTAIETSTLRGGVSNLLKQEWQSGPMLIAPAENTEVQTPYGTVAVAKGAVVLLIASAKGLALYNLHDLHKNSVTFQYRESTLNLAPGRSAILTAGENDHFEMVNPLEGIAYRRLTSRQLSEQHLLYQADFDVFSLVRSIAPLKNMITAQDPALRKAASSLLKTAAILSQIGGAEPFGYYATPAVTAYRQ